MLLGVASPRSVIAGLLLKRAEVSLAAIFEGRLDDDAFERLANVLMEVKQSKLLIELPDGQSSDR